MDDWAGVRLRGVVYEDEAVLALNKPVGVSVMGERHETDLVRMAAASGETLYPVHRIDKVTSGLVLLAKDLGVHGGLTRQFNARSVEKRYLAVTRSTGLPDRGVIDLPLSVGRKNRVRIAAARESIVQQDGVWTVPAGEVFTHVKSYPSVTEFSRLFQDGERTVLAVRPVSGRRHQIRVQLAWIGHPIEGDPLFEKAPGGRTFLHSFRLEVDAAWRGGERIGFEAAPGGDFWVAVDYAVQLT